MKSIKICGALGFVSKIMEMNQFIDSDYYIQKIKECNDEIIPTILKTYKSCQHEISIKDEYMESIQKDIEFLMKPNTKLGLEYIQKQKLEISGYEFDKNYPNFNSLQSEYNNLLKVIDELIKDRRVLKDFLKNMDNFITQYESTFNVKLQREIF